MANPNITKGFNKKAIALLMAIIVAIGATACSKDVTAEAPSEEPSTSTATESTSAPDFAELSNADDLITANEALTVASEKVATYSTEVFGGVADDAQRANIEGFFDAVNKARVQIAAADAQIATAETQVTENGENITYDQAGLDNLKQQVEAAIESVISRFEQKYQTRLTDDDGNWLASEAYLDENPEFVTLLTADATVDASKSHWNFREQETMNPFYNPNDNGDAYSAHGTFKVEKYVPAEEGEPIDATGFVLNYGEQEIEGVGTPDVKTYVLDKKVEPSAFSESTKTYWDPFTNEKNVTNPGWFEGLYLESKAQPGQYWGIAAGQQQLNSQVIKHDENVVEVFIRRSNITDDEVIDVTKFNTENDYYNVGGACPVGSVLDFNDLGDGTAVTVFEHSNINNYATVKYPNPNDSKVHESYDQTAENQHVIRVTIHPDGLVTTKKAA